MFFEKKIFLLEFFNDQNMIFFKNDKKKIFKTFDFMGLFGFKFEKKNLFIFMMV